MKHSIVLTMLALLVSVTVAAAASAPPGPFSTTGYTTNFEFAVLPSGLAQFRIQARGGPAYNDDSLCEGLSAGAFTSCDALCKATTDQLCGARGYFEGSFAFDEVGIGDPATLAGANVGLMNISTGAGSADLYFGGLAADGSVSGDFAFLGGTKDYRRLQGIGSYLGDADFVFTVDYTPCGHPNQPCPAEPCVARGEDLKLLRPKAMWTLGNYGQQTLRLESLLLHWPEQNGALTGVRLGGKLLAAGSWDAPWIDLDLRDAPARDREIRAGKSSKLMLDFENMGIGQAPADYTFLARFEEGCSAIHVAFP